MHSTLSILLMLAMVVLLLALRRRRSRAIPTLLVAGEFSKDLEPGTSLDFGRKNQHLRFVNVGGSRKQELYEMLTVARSLFGFSNPPSLSGYSEPGAKLLARCLEASEDGSVTMVLIAGLSEVADLLRSHAELVEAKVAAVAIMGGVEQKSGRVLLDEEGHMVPDSAANNKFDMEAASFVYKRFQELGIALRIVTREAAYAAPVPRDLYDRIAAGGHPLAVELRDRQMEGIRDLWYRANLDANDPGRQKLPERCDRDWFCDNFCHGRGKDRTGEDEIWNLIVSFQLYDPITLIAALPERASRFFNPVIVDVQGVEHQVIGLSKSLHGVRNPSDLTEFLVRCFLDNLLVF